MNTLVGLKIRFSFYLGMSVGLWLTAIRWSKHDYSLLVPVLVTVGVMLIAYPAITLLINLLSVSKEKYELAYNEKLMQEAAALDMDRDEMDSLSGVVLYVFLIAHDYNSTTTEELLLGFHTYWIGQGQADPYQDLPDEALLEKLRFVGLSDNRNCFGQDAETGLWMMETKINKPANILNQCKEFEKHINNIVLVK